MRKNDDGERCGPSVVGIGASRKVVERRSFARLERDERDARHDELAGIMRDTFLMLRRDRVPVDVG